MNHSIEKKLPNTQESNVDTISRRMQSSYFELAFTKELGH